MLKKRILFDFLASAKRDQRANKDHRLKWRFFVIFFRLIFFLFVFLIITLYGYQFAYWGRIYPGVRLGDFNLGGLKEEEAKLLLQPFLDDLEKRGFIFKGESPKGKKELRIQSIFVAIGDPDLSQRILSFDLDKTVENAMKIGRRGNFLVRAKEILFTLQRGYTTSNYFQLNEDKLLKILKENFEDLEKKPQPAAFILKKTGEIEFISEVGGYVFSYEKAVVEVKENLSLIRKRPVILTLEAKFPTITLAKIKSLEEELKNIIETAPFILEGNEKKWLISKKLLAQWLDFKDREPLEIALNFDKVNIFLAQLAKEVEAEPINAKFVMKNGRVIEFQASRPGLKIDIETTHQEIEKVILSGEKTIRLVINKIEPEVLTENVNELGIKELIGRGESDFKGSPKNRIHNIKTGANVLNGILIKPNEEFSLLKALGEVSEKTGYLPELVIKADRTIPELGGGLCQIGTTMFRLALNTGLPITQRVPHAFRVIYYEPAGVDATIYNPWPDFKFINDTPAYLLLQTRIDGTRLIFEFYGTDDGRKIKLSEPKIFNIVSPGPPLYIETTELPVGEKKRVEKAVAGADTEFERIITFPNGEVKKETWKSHYRPWREVWLVGVEKLTEEEISFEK